MSLRPLPPMSGAVVRPLHGLSPAAAQSQSSASAAQSQSSACDKKSDFWGDAAPAGAAFCDGFNLDGRRLPLSNGCGGASTSCQCQSDQCGSVQHGDPAVSIDSMFRRIRVSQPQDYEYFSEDPRAGASLTVKRINPLYTLRARPPAAESDWTAGVYMSDLPEAAPPVRTWVGW